MIADVISNEKLDQVVTEIFIRKKKLNIPTAFITRLYFPVPKNIRLNCTLNRYKKYTVKSCFLVIDTTLASDKCLRFRKNLLEKLKKIIMAIDNNIGDKKLQSNHYHEAEKISVSLLSKTDKNVTGEQILSPDQSRMIE